jgi:major intracellular serine protease
MNNFKLLNISQLWKHTMGEDINIAILDSGVDYVHEDLKSSIRGGVNFTTNNKLDYMDRIGHGTFCTGIISSKKTNGIAPRANVYAVKIINDNREGCLDWIREGIIWCLQNKINIISLSLAYKEHDQSVYELIQRMNKYNIIIVAANNNENTPDYPAAYSEVISCSNINKNMKDIIVSGDDILSTYINGTFNKNSGSSFSCACVTGIIALIQSKNLKLNGELLNREDVYKILKKNYNILI